MTIGIPISLSLQASNVLDPVETLEEIMLDCQAPIFTEGFEVRDSEWIYSYSGVDFTPAEWNQADADTGVYDIDEVLIKDCKLIKITGKEGEGIKTIRRPFEPEEYGAYDTGLNPATWSHRYMRVSNASKNGWLNQTWKSPTGKRWYYMFWEARGFGGCGGGAWRWSAKDLNANVGERNITWYLRTCLAGTYSNRFNAGKDIKAQIPNWGSTECGGGCPKEPTVQFKSMVERGGYFYFRTHLNKPIKYATFTTGNPVEYTTMDVLSPADIDGFVHKRRTNAHNPFDGKNYTFAHVDTTETDYRATWTCLATAPFDSIAFGHIVCDSIDIKFKDADGNLISELNQYRVDNTVTQNSDRAYYATVVLYASQLMDPETVIEITLHGSQVAIGEIIAAETLEAGFTKVNFKNKFKDFSPKEQDQWGNWYYKDGVRVGVHTGTVEFPIISYDGLNRLMLLIGGTKVVINSSDSTHNELPDGRNVFEATMMIARFTSFELSTSDVKKRIGEKGTYNFAIEELV